MSIEPYNRAERILSGEDLEPTTRLEYFMKEAASGGGGGGGETVVFNILEDEEMNYSLDDDKTFEDVSEAYASGVTIKWTVMGIPVAFVQYSSSGTSLENCYLYNVYYLPDELTPGAISEITFDAYNVSGSGVELATMTVFSTQS